MGVADDGRAIPIVAGGRLTGRVGGTNIGAIAMRTEDVGGLPGSDYTVLRVRQNVFEGSDIGGIFMMKDARRAVPDLGDDYNRVFGADANIRFFGNVDWNTYVVGTQSPGPDQGQYAWRTSLNRESNFVHAKFGAMQLGENFRDDLGFYRRTGVRKYFIDFGLRPRPETMRRHGVREMHPHIVWNYYEDLSGRMVAKNLHSGYTFFMNDGGYWELSVNPAFERIDAPFAISPDIDPIPVRLLRLDRLPAPRQLRSEPARLGRLHRHRGRAVERNPAHRERQRHAPAVLPLLPGGAAPAHVWRSWTFRTRTSPRRSGRSARTSRSTRTCSSTRSSSTTRAPSW